MAQALTALAIVAHPDDVEFMMAGTLLLLRRAGVAIHIWNLANGCCGSATLSREEIVALRWREAQAAARRLDAVLHPPCFDDITIRYDEAVVRRVAAMIREIKPDMIFTHPREDYMEDHEATGRLTVTAAFVRGMTNFVTEPPQSPTPSPVRIYHALPHGLGDWYGQPVKPDCYVDIEGVLAGKRAVLACHRSQKEWLDVSQGMNAYLDDMENTARVVGHWSGKFRVAEGWRRHSHVGFCPPDFDPLATLLGDHYAACRE